MKNYLPLAAMLSVFLAPHLALANLMGVVDFVADRISMETPHSAAHMELKTVGPGAPPHFHSIEIDKFERVEDIAKNPSEVPPPIKRTTPETLSFHLRVQEVVSKLADGTEYLFWTYNKTVPGPMLRARVGDTIVLKISNHETSTHDHSIDLHAVTGPGGGAKLTQTPPGKSKTISFKALHPGVYVYHCATANVPTHITNGLYGLIVIDPAEGLPKVDREFYVMQGEFYTQDKVGDKGFQNFSPVKMMDEKPEYIVLNGRVKALTGEKSLQASQGETIRIFIGNGGVSKISSFHIIGEIFDKVYPEASLTHVRESVQTTLVPAGGATVVELKLENSGDYILLDHAISRIDRGAFGILSVAGDPVPELLSDQDRN